MEVLYHSPYRKVNSVGSQFFLYRIKTSPCPLPTIGVLSRSRSDHACEADNEAQCPAERPLCFIFYSSRVSRHQSRVLSHSAKNGLKKQYSPRRSKIKRSARNRVMAFFIAPGFCTRACSMNSLENTRADGFTANVRSILSCFAVNRAIDASKAGASRANTQSKALVKSRAVNNHILPRFSIRFQLPLQFRPRTEILAFNGTTISKRISLRLYAFHQLVHQKFGNVAL